MKSAVKFPPAIFALALLAFAAISCRKPAAPPPAWAVELHAETAAAQAVFRMSATRLTPGAVLNCELEVRSPAAAQLEAPQLNLAGLERVDFTALPAALTEAGDERRQFRWTFQAGAPDTVTNQSLPLRFISAQQTNSLKIALPAIVIQSAFAPGTFTNALPPLEETNAL
jgi:hypothetical protein